MVSVLDLRQLSKLKHYREKQNLDQHQPDGGGGVVGGVLGGNSRDTIIHLFHNKGLANLQQWGVVINPSQIGGFGL